MNRSTYLMAALVLAAVAAVGAYLWLQASGRLPASMQASTPSADAQLVALMNDVAASGGYAATFAEKDARRWKLAAGHQLERFSLNEGDAVLARLTSNVALAQVAAGQVGFKWSDQGLSLSLPADLAQRANGQRLEIGIVARLSKSNASEAVSVVYATQQAGNSGWQVLKLSPQFELQKFVYDVPYVAEGYTAAPIVVIHADTKGKAHSVELLGVYVKLVSP